MRVPFRVAPFIIPSALEPVEELLIVSLPITAESVREVKEFAAKTGLKIDRSGDGRAVRSVDAGRIRAGAVRIPDRSLGTEQARAA